jgi:hypothetical protein
MRLLQKSGLFYGYMSLIRLSLARFVLNNHLYLLQIQITHGANKIVRRSQQAAHARRAIRAVTLSVDQR